MPFYVSDNFYRELKTLYKPILVPEAILFLPTGTKIGYNQKAVWR
jgi:hypothetical protein